MVLARSEGRGQVDARAGERAAQLAAARRRRAAFQPSSRRSLTRRIAAWSASRRAVVPTMRWW